MTSIELRPRLARVFDRLSMNAVAPREGTPSPVPAIIGSLAAGALLAMTLVLGPASGGSEPTVTGSVLFAFGVGWALMGYASARFSAQPQTWMMVPAGSLAAMGLLLIVVQPGPGLMDIVSWIWPAALAILAVWMIAQVRRHLRGRGRWLVVPVIVALLVFAIGGGLTTIGTAAGSNRAAGSGRLVDVGGHRLYLECTGTGSPTVVLQAGLGASSGSWGRIAPSVAASTTVCAYDRAGHGRSDEAAGPQDGIALATDLHTLLERAGVAGPYILVGHSSGGPYVRVFAAQYPDEVLGMVLLDAQPAEAFAVLPDYPGFYSTFRIVATVSPSLARVGLIGPALGLSADESTLAAVRGGRDEFLALPAALEQAQTLTNLGDQPLIVVTAGTGQQTGWFAAQDRMAEMSTASMHRVVAAATHDSLISGEDAAASTQAILDLVTSVRTGVAPR